jgi:REP element-mobilizing transposase RayT
MAHISKNNPFYFITCVTHKRLPVFRTDKLKSILANAFDEARRSAGFSIFAYVIMPEHFHIVTDSHRTMSETIRFLNGISARRVINYLKENGLTESLNKLRIMDRGSNYKYSLWEHHSNSFSISSEAVLRQKVHYIHCNPVEDGLVGLPEDYLYSSVRFWHKRVIEDEPLMVDIGTIDWRA